MKNILPSFIFAALILSSCGDQTKETITESKTQSDTISLENTIPGSTDTLHIIEPMVLVTWPDSIQMEQLKAKDSDAFYVGADDFSFYTSGLMMQAESLNIKSGSTNLKYLDFLFRNGQHYIINRTAEEHWWETYAFNGIDTPETVSISGNYTPYLKTYFKK